VFDLTVCNVDLSDFWELLYVEEAILGDLESGFVHLCVGDMYLLSTYEMFKVPDNMCAELCVLDLWLGMFFFYFVSLRF
jgi:deoxycytidine triphosphate deaminase